MDCSANTTPLLQDLDSEDEQISNDLPTRSSNPLFNTIEHSDKYNMGYIIFYLLGIATLLPWNFYVTANDVSMNYLILMTTFIFSLLLLLFHFHLCINNLLSSG